MTLNIILFFIGLLLLYFGAESLVTGSSRLALSYGIKPLIIGMTIVAFATSMPEMLVSLIAAFKGSSDMATGNIIGSNIANIGLIMGVAAILSPMNVLPTILVRELPIMIAASFLLLFFSLNGVIGFYEGLTLFILLLLFIYYCIRNSKEKPSIVGAGDTVTPPIKQKANERTRDIIFIICGIIGLGFGAEMMVRSASTIAREIGISELAIGVTIVALGTSLPELAASIMSAWKGEMDISIGNIIGSNIFNILFVLGICPMIRPLTVDSSVLTYEFPIMITFAIVPAIFLYKSHQLSRKNGILLLTGYVGFIWSMFA